MVSGKYLEPRRGSSSFWWMTTNRFCAVWPKRGKKTWFLGEWNRGSAPLRAIATGTPTPMRVVDLRLQDWQGLDVGPRCLRDKTPPCAGVVLTGYGAMPPARCPVKIGRGRIYLSKPAGLRD